MQLISTIAARNLATHDLRRDGDEPMRTCTKCGLQVPVENAAVSYQVANVQPCKGKGGQDGEP